MLLNSTVSDNVAGGNGGGLWTDNGGSLTNLTITDNQGSGGSGVHHDSSPAPTAKNTIVANQAAGADCNAALTSDGSNLDSDTSCFSGGTDKHIDPMLGGLADNGGPTMTHALLDGSPAIDGGTNTGCPATDQRGVDRPIDGDGDSTATCDVGAFEFERSEADLALIKGDGTDPVAVGEMFAYGLQVTNLGPGEATDVVVVDTLPPEVSFSSAVVSQGACEHVAGVVTCELGTLRVGNRARIRIIVEAVAPGVVTNTAEVAAAEDDPTSPNEASEDTTINDVPNGESHLLTVERSGRGKVRSQPSGISCGRDCEETYGDGATVILRARPRSGNEFAGWGGDCASVGLDPTCTVVMDGDKVVTASFTPAP